ncbi:uncharacterized protein [Vulpes vulpes]|uniref:Basic proline-rich protein-like n=1 Tax=Vulpes vulpes TaxID=9627 RepID=A0ABM4XTT3_VULVU
MASDEALMSICEGLPYEETHRERQRHRPREKQAPCGDPDAGLDPPPADQSEPKQPLTTEPPRRPREDSARAVPAGRSSSSLGLPSVKWGRQCLSPSCGGLERQPRRQPGARRPRGGRGGPAGATPPARPGRSPFTDPGTPALGILGNLQGFSRGREESEDPSLPQEAHSVIRTNNKPQQAQSCLSCSKRGATPLAPHPPAPAPSYTLQTPSPAQFPSPALAPRGPSGPQGRPNWAAPPSRGGVPTPGSPTRAQERARARDGTGTGRPSAGEAGCTPGRGGSPLAAAPRSRSRRPSSPQRPPLSARVQPRGCVTGRRRRERLFKGRPRAHLHLAGLPRRSRAAPTTDRRPPRLRF